MDLDNSVDGIIFSKDVNFAYTIRNKCSELGVYLDYSPTTQDILRYYFDSKGGFIFIDYKSFDYMSLLQSCLNSEKIHNYNVILLTDNKEIDVEVDDRLYVSNLKNIGELVLKLKYLNSHESDVTAVSKNEIYKNIILFLEKYGISPKHIGYSYIKECVAFCVESNDCVLNFSINVYPIIASRFHTCSGNVDKNIRTAIKKAYEKNPQLFDVEDICHRAITNAGFLNHIIEKVKIKCIECSA